MALDQKSAVRSSQLPLPTPSSITSSLIATTAYWIGKCTLQALAGPRKDIRTGPVTSTASLQIDVLRGRPR
ncbi:hypothetical protein J6590_057608 [Homalodisca vitripennis]|nr:hypothetical protein J6590_057608 [Homalodisca vitripennis]